MFTSQAGTNTRDAARAFRSAANILDRDGTEVFDGVYQVTDPQTGKVLGEVAIRTDAKF